MKILFGNSKVKPSLQIHPYYINKPSLSVTDAALQAGEWLLVSNDSESVLKYCVDPAWNREDISQYFRLFANKTLRLWGEEVALELSEMEDVALDIIRGISLSQYHPKNGIFNQKSESSPKCYILGSKKIKPLIPIAIAQAEMQMWAMSLVDSPPNKKTPEIFGAAAKELAKELDFACEVWNDDHIINGGLHALHAVGKGSANPPVFIISRYRGRSESENVDLALVGKGITFDTGGISIKGSANLHYMKSDMAGAAAMLGAIALAAKLKLKLNITAIVPSAENSVDAHSLLPGDVIESYSGKTIEIINTDAEGRLVLADGLAWVIKNEQPNIVIDMATLTGSSVRALGFEAAALYSENETLTKMLYDAGIYTGEKLWSMPLWKDYDTYIHSDVADVSNLPLKPVAGSIAAAKFLQVFTNAHSAWAHIDMPGVSFKDSGLFKTKSATGFGICLLYHFMTLLEQNTDIANEK